MGGSTSKPKPAFVPDVAQATFSGQYVSGELSKASQVVSNLGTTISSLTIASYSLGTILTFALIAFGIYYAIFWFGNINNVDPLHWFSSSTTPSASIGPNNLLIHTATYGTKDVTSVVGTYVKVDTLTIPNPLHTTLGGAETDRLTLTYEFSSDPNKEYSFTSTDDKTDVVISPSNNSGSLLRAPAVAPVAPKQAQPSFFSGWFSGTGGTGNLLPSALDATTSTVVKAKDAPLSAESQGAYGMQWWMFVRDWNYGYGKDKEVVVRTDPTNTAVANPRITLHPTDNTLKVSVSLFPSTSDGSTKTQPAPAGHSGSTDDVYVCEVPNIPLQDWFSVSVTVFERNLDVYIDGKLVKSCFLPGVPKPAAGDIILAGNGGFSGNMCNFYHYPRMITPGDALTFYGGGTSCKSITEPSTASKATGYSVKFGVYDPVGKKVQEYSF